MLFQLFMSIFKILKKCYRCDDQNKAIEKNFGAKEKVKEGAVKGGKKETDPKKS